MTEDLLIEFITNVCIDQKVQPDAVCRGIIDNFGPVVYFILKNTPLTDEEAVANLLSPDCLQYYDNSTVTRNIKWEIDLPPKRWEMHSNELNGEQEKNLKVLQISDIHMDLEYIPGGIVNCGEPLCCRASSTKKNDDNTTAGYWGEPRGECDAPTHLVEQSLRHISEAHTDIDVIFWTGDNVPHSVWNTSVESNLLYNQLITDSIKKHFPKAAVYPILGNHEGHPVNVYVKLPVHKLINN